MGFETSANGIERRNGIVSTVDPGSAGTDAYKVKLVIRSAFRYFLMKKFRCKITCLKDSLIAVKVPSQ